MKKMIIFLLVISFFALMAEDEKIDKYTEILKSTHNFELIKYFMETEEYSHAITIIDSTLLDSVMVDSLIFFKGLAYEGLKDWDKATLEFSKIIMCTTNDSLKNSAKDKFKQSILHVNPVLAVEKVTAIFDTVNTDSLHNDLLLTIAEIYETNQLFSEAIDIYKNIRKDTTFSDTVFLDLKIAVNNIFQKKYNKAIEILDQIIISNDSLHIEDALYFSYISWFSLDNFPKAKFFLIHLYTDFPKAKNRFDIIFNLAGLYANEGQHLLSWYLLNELFEESSEVQKFIIYSEINRIKDLLVQDSLTVNQFKNFKPIFEEQLQKEPQ